MWVAVSIINCVLPSLAVVRTWAQSICDTRHFKNCPKASEVLMSQKCFRLFWLFLCGHLHAFAIVFRLALLESDTPQRWGCAPVGWTHRSDTYSVPVGASIWIILNLLQTCRHGPAWDCVSMRWQIRVCSGLSSWESLSPRISIVILFAQSSWKGIVQEAEVAGPFLRDVVAIDAAAPDCWRWLSIAYHCLAILSIDIFCNFLAVQALLVLSGSVLTSYVGARDSTNAWSQICLIVLQRIKVKTSAGSSRREGFETQYLYIYSLDMVQEFSFRGLFLQSWFWYGFSMFLIWSKSWFWCGSELWLLFFAIHIVLWDMFWKHQNHIDIIYTSYQNQKTLEKSTPFPFFMPTHGNPTKSLGS